MNVGFPASVFKCVEVDSIFQQLISARWEYVCVDFIGIDLYAE